MPKNKTVIVTGASSGIGGAVARRMARAGANVVVFARRAERLEALCAEIDPAGTRTLAVAGDVNVAIDRERLVRVAVERFGRIDALVNNAGYGQRGPIERIPLEALRANFETNVFSLVALTQLVAPVMRTQARLGKDGTGKDGGRIINIGSVAGRITRPMSAAYDSTKFALEGITDGLRGELKPFGIDVVLVRPGFIRTEFGQVADAVSNRVLSGDGAGPYAPYVGDFQTKRVKLRRVAGVPDDIARLVEKALTARRPRAHYNGPAHAKLFLFLKWLLPVRAMDWALRMKRHAK
ncbi:NAD(P)-dependent dehydrogenase (short-subunit alcohol dehydrogenase family) [Ereboglobus sp. PH5-5]|uniref:SDR family NAD(P)-dependent oxidoreductase n=1 Tax=Ereboglobus sp. PH5-5 TaxID=2940529 RepID=UPI0024075248|nr:SDR family NAD(P)-dependent oxidoreductase [Ereboglobus sp. PH5-5]MDF9833716.1 NAD(P)-dependent dehydrogenase (short-subunit alcohol dehydrogenase family) [Ereboglobus sp. PH5-5]